MKIETLTEIIGSEFYTGVPDSLLKPLCDYLEYTYGTNSKNHIICANEGNSIALAAGYYLSTGKIPVVYMQNSGIGNIINPITSLTNQDIYSIPQIFIIGWRGEPKTKDEPQHVFQGKITTKLLKLLNVSTYIISKKTTLKNIKKTMEKFKKELNKGKSVAFIIKKDSLEYKNKATHENSYKLTREEAIKAVKEDGRQLLNIDSRFKDDEEIVNNALEKAEDYAEFFDGVIVIKGDYLAKVGKIPKIVKIE